MKPYLVSEIRDPRDKDSKVPVTFGPVAVGRAVSEETSRTVRLILRKAVEAGTGQKAKPAGYSAAGKTGTAQKIDQRTGQYSKEDYVSSFVGFAPTGAPKLVIVVMIDSPVGVAAGGSVAAPVFKAVAEQSLTYLQVRPDDLGGRMLLVSQ